MTSHLHKDVVSFALMERLRGQQGSGVESPIVVHENWHQTGKFLGYLLAIGAVSLGGVINSFNNSSPVAEVVPITSAASYHLGQLHSADTTTIS